MNRVLVLLLGLVGVLGVAGYAQNVRFEAVQSPTVLAGVVNSDGSTERGFHFLVHHVSTGVYRIHFHDGYFGSACPVVTATVIGHEEFATPNSLAVFEHEQNCKVYTIYTYNNQSVHVDKPFNFIALGMQ
jgi:hypothetical protein